MDTELSLAQVRIALKVKQLAEQFKDGFEDFVDGLFAVNPNAFEVSKDVDSDVTVVESEVETMVKELFATRPKAKISVRVSFQPMAKGATITIRGRF